MNKPKIGGIEKNKIILENILNKAFWHSIPYHTCIIFAIDHLNLLKCIAPELNPRIKKSANGIFHYWLELDIPENPDDIFIIDPYPYLERDYIGPLSKCNKEFNLNLYNKSAIFRK